ncbi:uncharacterized protein ASPGLDRAFT_57364 [Aspergillus glaucus CBS 516.65]|uniref:C2H2-type domain-containing protein n=1 Tax=Aspergillus glaucus CBS 516.65 TaxID=1160497 RepID=A0A1L9VMP3_ASPGL|nr:hypothetical protein ASPGLDRAFT_57364 [Aspergillus glaucus CBS 516.65]OJJ85189.1 hypothetical protein ASPGLDRAFT_57364 [Aspergillus glaucus CBS 516.65]
MDVANLISHGPDHFPKRPLYSPPSSKSFKFDDKSYFTAAPTPTSYYSRSPQPPLSPPVEDLPKCTLPSISTLFEGADSAAMHPSKRQRMTSPDSRPQSRAYEPVMATVPVCLPPTPPMRPGSTFHRASHSPSVSSVNDKALQHPIALPTDRSSISSQGSIQAGPYASPAPSVTYASSPIETSAPAPATTAAPAPTVYYHPRPAPAMAPAPAPVAAAPQQMISPVNPAWQHHHYFPPSNTAPYQQNHDRYICRTCHKAFSRPSSLRIHSHSHTGEKPFRCTHAGCGKAFSVRSNMKRHERGCHSGRPVATVV